MIKGCIPSNKCMRLIAKIRAIPLLWVVLFQVTSLWLDLAELPHKILDGNLSVYDCSDGHVTSKLEFC